MESLLFTPTESSEKNITQSSQDAPPDLLHGFHILKEIFQKQQTSEKSLKAYHSELQEKCFLLEEKKTALERLLKQRDHQLQTQLENLQQIKKISEESEKTHQKEILHLQQKINTLIENQACEKKASVQEFSHLTQQLKKLESCKVQNEIEIGLLQSKIELHTEKIAQQQVTLLQYQKQQQELYAAYQQLSIMHEKSQQKNRQFEISWAKTAVLHENAQQSLLHWNQLKTQLTETHDRLKIAEKRCEAIEHEYEQKRKHFDQLHDLYLKERREKNLLLEQLKSHDTPSP